MSLLSSTDIKCHWDVQVQRVLTGSPQALYLTRRRAYIFVYTVIFLFF